MQILCVGFGFEISRFEMAVDDIGVTASMLELMVSVEGSSSRDVRSAQIQDVNQNHLL